MLSERVKQAIENVFDDKKQEMLNFINHLLRQQHSENEQTAKYNFSDIAGKLTWRGDAVAIQREMRDEW